ncbi:MAG TPA: beta-N-acetylhexosaminidase N-terminal domain-containing protein, partial [Candidatus Acidoferrum sp.]|nr:beta-N-acetylhexosaminidase N-terminal domain-containing protein [Candidatus Acidoferrum sp.]
MRSPAQFLFLATLMFASQTNSQSSQPLNLMPQPADVNLGSGALKIDVSFTIALAGHTEPRLDRAATRFLAQLQRQSALLFAPQPSRSAAKATLVIHTDHASKDVQELGEDESYTLEVTTSGAKLTAA